MEFKGLIEEYKTYNKQRIKKLILYSIIGFYLLFLYLYNIHRQYGLSIQLSWLNGIISALITTLIYLFLFNFLGFLLKTEHTKQNLKINLFIVLIGVVMLLFAGIIGINNENIMSLLITVPSVFLAFFMPLILSIIGYLGIIIVLLGKRYGNYIILLAGGIAIIGMFITIFSNSIITIPLVLTFIFIDPFLIIIGGVLGLIFKA